jgi:hypothetical protein
MALEGAVSASKSGSQSGLDTDSDTDSDFDLERMGARAGGQCCEGEGEMGSQDCQDGNRRRASGPSCYPVRDGLPTAAAGCSALNSHRETACPHPTTGAPSPKR